MDIDRETIKDLEVLGDEREAIKKKIDDQMREWGLRLPDVFYLMVHFGLNDFFQTGETEFWVANEVESGYCAKLIFVFDAQTCPYHNHKVKHETFYVLKGKTKMAVDGQELIKEQGDILVVPVGVKHSFTGIGPCLLLEVSMPCSLGDSYFENNNIGKDGVL